MTRALIITPLRPPDPTRDHHGVYQRLRLFVQALRQVHDRVDMVHFVPSDRLGNAAEHQATEASGRFWGSAVGVRLLPLDQHPRTMWQAGLALLGLRYRGDYRPFLGPAPIAGLKALMKERPDVVFAHRLSIMEALGKVDDPLPPIFFDLDDVEHLVKLRAAANALRRSSRLQLRLESKALADAERRAIAAARLSFICSQSDRTRLDTAGFDTRTVAVVPNAVVMPAIMPRACDEPHALFLGNYGHPPNAEAAERLITVIWPLVRAALPTARLIIAGAQPEMIPSHREEPDGVEFTGLVEDLDALYARTRIVCCPLLNGGGTRLKLIEAASRGVPIAATHVAAEGLALRDGRDILLRDDDMGLAQACLALLTDDDLAASQAEAAFRTVSQLYQPPRIQNLILAAMSKALIVPHAPPHIDGGVRSPIRHLSADEVQL